MNMEQNLQDVKRIREQSETIDYILELNRQLVMLTREGMIQAIIKSQKCAGEEIVMLEHQQRECNYMPIMNATDDQLYNKILQFRQAVYNHCVNKLGQEVIDNILKEFSH